MNKVFQPHEAHIPYLLQVNYLHLQPKADTCSVCELEIYRFSNFGFRDFLS